MRRNYDYLTTSTSFVPKDEEYFFVLEMQILMELRRERNGEARNVDIIPRKVSVSWKRVTRDCDAKE